VLKALHAKINVKFSVKGVERTVGTTASVSVRQGDLLGLILFNFRVWRER
jgi:hypothetical protein